MLMKLTATTGTWASVVYVAAFVILGNLILARLNPRPPTERYRLDGGTPWVAFWNLFDKTVFTPEAIDYHRRTLVAIPVVLGTFVFGWLLLGLIW